MLKKLAGVYLNRIRPHARKIVVGLFIFFFVFTVTGFFVLPPIVKSVLTKQLSANLHREVTIGEVRINPYTLSVAVRGLSVGERSSAATFLSCQEVFVNLESSSLLRLALIVKEVRLTRPSIKIVRNDDLSYNFSDLLEKQQPAAQAAKGKSRPLRFSVNNIRIENGSIDFMDGPNKTKHTVRELTIGIPFLSNIRSYVQRFVQPYFSARIDDALYTIQGKTKPFADSLETFVEVNVKDFNVPYYLAYIPMKMKLEIASALVDTQARVSFIETKDRKSYLTVQGGLALKNLVVNDEKKRPFFKLPLLDVGIAPSEPLSQVIHLSKVSIQSPDVEVRRDANGVLNIAAILPQESEAKPAAKKTEKAEKPAKTEKTGKTAETSHQALSLDIDAITLSGGRIAFSDVSAGKPFKTVLSPVELKVDHFSNGRDRQAVYTLSIESEAKETVKAQGRFSLDPIGSEGMLEVSSVVLKKYGPLLSNVVLFDIRDGRLDVSTLYKYAQGLKEPELDLSGLSLSLRSLRLGKAGEKADFFKLPALAISHAELDLAKRALRVGSFSTRGGEVLVERLQNGDLSLLKLFPSAPAAADGPKKAAEATGAAAGQKAPPGKTAAKAKAAEPEKPWLVLLKQVLVDKYTVRVEDRTTPTPAVLVAQNLRIRGDNISTAKNARGKIDVSCLLNGKGKVSVAGRLGIEPVFADLRVSVAGVEAAPFQPYFADKVTMTVTGGSLSTTGAFSLSSDKDGRVKAAYKGDASVVNFSSIDRSRGQDLLKLESLSLSGMAVNTEPPLRRHQGDLAGELLRPSIDQPGREDQPQGDAGCERGRRGSAATARAAGDGCSCAAGPGSPRRVGVARTAENRSARCREGSAADGDQDRPDHPQGRKDRLLGCLRQAALLGPHLRDGGEGVRAFGRAEHGGGRRSPGEARRLRPPGDHGQDQPLERRPLRRPEGPPEGPRLKPRNALRGDLCGLHHRQGQALPRFELFDRQAQARCRERHLHRPVYVRREGR